MVADWLLKPHSGVPLIPNWVFINSKIKADELWMLFFDCEDTCLPAYVGMCPKSNPARNWLHPYKHAEIWDLGRVLWKEWSTASGRCFSGHRNFHIYFGWDLAVLMFTVANDIACSKIQGFDLPAPFFAHTTPSWSICLGGFLLPPASLGKAVMPTFKVIKKEEIERYSSLELIWN